MLVGSMVVCCSRGKFPRGEPLACFVCIFVSGTLTFAGLVMGWFVSFVKSSDITGGNSEFAFCTFSGDIFTGRFGSVYGAGTFARAFLLVGDISLDSLS